MNITTFADDLLGLEPFSKRLESFIDTEHEFVEGGLVIALSSKYGSGKSTFLNMWRSALTASDTQPKRTVIYLNSWESDYIGDPLFSIISALVQTFQNNQTETKALVEAAKDLAWMGVSIGSQLAAQLTGINLTDAEDYTEGKKATRKQIPLITDAFSTFEKRKAAMVSLKRSIQSLIESQSPKVLFLVDELDRCRPDYAITYLEVIKHIFDIKGAVFILAADRQQLQNSAKTAFGQDLDFEEYYRKFIHREVSLPEIPQNTYQTIANHYVRKYLVREGSRFCFMKLEDIQLRDIGEITGKLKLTPRQIQNVFRILGHLLEIKKESAGKMSDVMAMGSIFMAILNIGAPEVFHKLGNQSLEPVHAVKFLKNLGVDYLELWFLILYTGGGLLVTKDESVEVTAQQLGLDLTRCNVDHILISRDWGHKPKRRINEIFIKIKQIEQWS